MVERVSRLFDSECIFIYLIIIGDSDSPQSLACNTWNCGFIPPYCSQITDPAPLCSCEAFAQTSLTLLVFRKLTAVGQGDSRALQAISPHSQRPSNLKKDEEASAHKRALSQRLTMGFRRKGSKAGQPQEAFPSQSRFKIWERTLLSIARLFLFNASLVIPAKCFQLAD